MIHRKRTKRDRRIGPQVVKVLGVREKRSRNGYDIILLDLCIEGHWGRLVHESLVFGGNSWWKVEQVLAALGKVVADGEIVRSHHLLGLRARVEIDVRLDPERPRRKDYYVRKWLPADKAAPIQLFREWSQ
jgi:hypothetical protein